MKLLLKKNLKLHYQGPRHEGLGGYKKFQQQNLIILLMKMPYKITALDLGLKQIYFVTLQKGVI
jgi:hypothetical protein